MMITNKEREFLQKIFSGEISKEDCPKKYSATMKRVQEQIDNGVANLLWLVENCPEILKDEKREIDDSSLERFRRFKAFAFIITKLDPMTEVEEVNLPEVLRKLGRLYPKYYFEIILKNKSC